MNNYSCDLFFGVYTMNDFKRGSRHYTRRRTHLAPRENVPGTVKWNDPRREFGFVATEFGDVHIHIKAVQAAGFASLTDGQNVVVDIQPSDTARGENRYRVKRLVTVYPRVLSTTTRKSQSPERPRPEQAVAKLRGQTRGGSEPTTSG